MESNTTSTNDDAQNENAIETLQKEVRDADRLADTPFGEWYNTVRTTSQEHIGTVICGVRVNDDGSYTSSVDKLAAGTWTPETQAQYDVVVSAGPRPFWSDSEAQRAVLNRLVTQ